MFYIVEKKARGMGRIAFGFLCLKLKNRIGFSKVNSRLDFL